MLSWTGVVLGDEISLRS